MESDNNPLIWYVSIEDNITNKVEKIVGDLSEFGITINDGNEVYNSDIGIIFFDVPASISIIIEFLRKKCYTLRIKLIAIYLNENQIERHLELELYKNGVSYVLDWNQNFHPEKIVFAYLSKWQLIRNILGSHLIKENLIGESDIWLSILERIIEICYFTTAPLLIMGESGTGKELIARLIHTLDTRKNKGDLIILDCASIVPELSGSEFFGHEKGAFTSAINARDGAFSLANNGTLFLDEIGELPLRMQGELLRVMQENMYKKVGSNSWNKTSFRLVSASNRNLPDEVSLGNFRHDLYYRISTFTISLPSLQDRKEDIPILAEYFLKKNMDNDQIPEISDAVMGYLLMKEYKGNIRELEHLIQRIAVRHVGDGPITLGDLPETDKPFPLIERSPWTGSNFKLAIRHAIFQGNGLKEIKENVANMAMEIAIENEKGNLQRAAQLLNVSDRTLQLYCASQKRKDIHL